MPLGVLADRRSAVRKLAGNLDTNDISDADLDKIIDIHDNEVQVATNRTDWNSNSFEWPSLLKASDLLSSAEIADGIPTQAAQGKPDQQRIAARDILRAINRVGSEQGQGITNPTFFTL